VSDSCLGFLSWGVGSWSLGVLVLLDEVNHLFEVGHRLDVGRTVGSEVSWRLSVWCSGSEDGGSLGVRAGFHEGVDGSSFLGGFLASRLGFLGTTGSSDLSGRLGLVEFGEGVGSFLLLEDGFHGNESGFAFFMGAASG